MKKAILLVLIFVGYQFMVSLLFIMLNYILKGSTALGANELGLSSLISGLLMIGHLIYCKDVVFNKKSFFEVPVSHLLLCLPLVFSAMYFLNVVNEMLDFPNWGEETFKMMSKSIWGVLSMVFVAPFAEELLFRGAMERHFLKQGKSPAFAIVVSSLFFAVIHGNPAQIFFAFLIGMLLGWLYYRTGSIVPAVLCHILNNGLAVVCMWYMPDVSTEEIVDSPFSFLVLMIVSLIIFAASFFYARKHFPNGSSNSF